MYKNLLFVIALAIMFVVDQTNAADGQEGGLSQDAIKGQKSLEKIKKLESMFSDGVIIFDTHSYKDLVLNTPRPYDVVMVYSVEQYCDHCIEVISEFRGAAYSFQQEKDKSLKDREVFFGILYHKGNDKELSKIFVQHDMKTVPFLAVSGHQTKRLFEQDLYVDSDKWLVNQNELYEQQKQLDFINARIQTDVKLILPFTQILFRNSIFFVAVIYFIYMLEHVREFLQFRIVWMIIAMGTYELCVGGIVYCFLNNVPMFKYVQDEYGRQVVGEIIRANDSRSQYMGEGQIFSCLCIICGILLIIMSRMHEKDLNDTQKRIRYLSCLVVMCIILKIIDFMCKIKQAWFNPSFLPPDYYMRGPLLREQGNNI